MVIHNATFMVLPDKEGELILWLKGEIASMSLADGRAPRVSAMREAGGISHRQAEAASVAFQVEFDDIDRARTWGKEEFAALADAFSARFGADSMVFTSIFEIV